MIEIQVNDVTQEGMRRVKVVSDSQIEPAALPVFISPGANVRTWSDELLGLHHLEALWACREVIEIKAEGWTCPRKMVLWMVLPGERVSLALKEALGVFGSYFKSFPAYAFMKKLPAKIENGFEVDDIMLFEAEWVPPGCIAVCKGDHYGLEAVAM